MAESPLRALVIGCGNMGASHARAYAALDGFELAGLAAPTSRRREPLAKELGVKAHFSDAGEALRAIRPDVVAVCSYPDTHAQYVMAAMEAGAHVFVEKPIAMTVDEARRVVEAARRLRRKIVVGYILRQHPAWIKFIEIARTLGKPLVMRMNLNQQSSGPEWDWHKNLMNSMPPLVDCGVHYVDVMCQMTRAKPVRVQAVGARLTEQIKPGIYNYGHLHVAFDDGSVGWYEAGWGPMMSEEAFFVKDVVGPRGCVSIVKSRSGVDSGSAEIDSHTKTNCLRVHRADQDSENRFIHEDEWIDTADEPDHQELCNREQAYLLRAIREDLDLTEHLDDAVNSLRIVLAADQSVRGGKTVTLD